MTCWVMVVWLFYSGRVAMTCWVLLFISISLLDSRKNQPTVSSSFLQFPPALPAVQTLSEV